MVEPKTPNEDWMSHVQGTILPEIVDSTVTILRVSEQGKFRVDRSGVLIQIADKLFLLTAAHKLQERLSEGTPLCIALEKEPHVLLLKDCEFHGTETSSRDIAIIHLAPDVAAQVREEKTPLRCTNIGSSAWAHKGLFLSIGFPQDWFGIDEYGFQLRPLPHLGYRYAGEVKDFNDLTYDSKIHGAFEFQSQVIKVGNAMQVPLPDHEGLKGISGCGIWQVSTADIKGGQLPQLSDGFRLVAIQHCHDGKDCYVLGTWIEHVLTRLVESYPELRSAMQLVYRQR